MTVLTNFKNYLKTLDLADYYYVGKIDNSKQKVIGVYGSGIQGRVEAMGKNSSYDIATVRLLVHWNKNATETEDASRDIYLNLRYITDTDMGDTHVNYIDLLDAEPTFIGTDDNGVYEYHISLRIYYRR